MFPKLVVCCEILNHTSNRLYLHLSLVFVGLVTRCEGSHNAVKSGNVTASERKGLMLFRKLAASGSRALTWNTFTTALLSKCNLILKEGFLVATGSWRLSADSVTCP